VRYKLLGEGAMVLEGRLDELAEAEAVIFDCDGVLIDSTKSYHLADRIATCIILDKLYGVKPFLGEDFEDALRRIEVLGGFNNDWHKTALMIQAISIHLKPPKTIRRDLGRIDVSGYVKRCEVGESSPEEVKTAIDWVRVRAGEMYGRYVDLKFFEKELEEEAKKLGRIEELNELREALGPLTGYGSGLLTTLYDEIYLGEEGIREKYGSEPRYVSWRGLLDREVVLVQEEVLEELLRLLPRGIAMATGRGRWETEKVLGGLTGYFDLDVGVFSADDPMSYEKPSSKILLECSRRLGAGRIIYVGDSFEDLLSARRASEEGLDALFVGVLTNPYSLDLFIEQEADAIIDDVNVLPRILKKEEKFWSPY